MIHYSLAFDGQIIFNVSDIFELVDPSVSRMTIDPHLPIGKVTQKTIRRYCQRLHLNPEQLTITDITKLGSVSPTMKAITDHVISYVEDNNLNDMITVNKVLYLKLLKFFRAYCQIMDNGLQIKLCDLARISGKLNSMYQNFTDMTLSSCVTDTEFNYIESQIENIENNSDDDII